MSRALLGKDGMTTVDISTGTLDLPGAPGVLTKVQAKLFDQAKVLLGTANYNGPFSDATASFSYPGLTRSSTVQVQANVRGIDGRRTDVVTVMNQVKLRPDLSVLSVSAPQKTLVGPVPVRVTAVVGELNGEVGAKATCILTLDGTPTDQAEGIWVDAGSRVTCQFAVTFSHAADIGMHTLAVTAGIVTPGDWDLANNVASTTIEVDREVRLRYQAYASQQIGMLDYRSTTSYNSAYCHTYQFLWWTNTDYCTYSHSDDILTSHTDYREQGTSLVASVAEEIQFPVTHLALAQTTGATVLDRRVYDGLPASSQWGDLATGGACAAQVDAGVEFTLCSSHDNGAAQTSLGYFRNAGDATYLSSAYQNYYYCTTLYSWFSAYTYCGSGHYVYYNNARAYASPTPFVEFAHDVEFDVAIMNGPYTSYLVNSHVALTSQPFEYPYAFCYTSWYGYLICNSSTSKGVATSGADVRVQ